MVVAHDSGMEVATATKIDSRPKRSVKVSALSQLMKVNTLLSILPVVDVWHVFSDRCKLPKVPGPCDGYYPQWYYDRERKVCSQFIYGGCLGNNNKFDTRDECQNLCVKDDTAGE